jgi:hypothetical protein
MPSNMLSFHQLDGFLTSLGYELVKTPSAFVYRREGFQSMFLPVLAEQQVVPGISMAVIESTLLHDGVIRHEGLPALLAAAVERMPKRRAKEKSSAKSSRREANVPLGVAGPGGSKAVRPTAKEETSQAGRKDRRKKSVSPARKAP